MKSKCKLCGKESVLQMGHIVPKFVLDWLKKTSITGYLRQAIEVNVRRQDGPKALLFCRDCEQLISKFEYEFAEKIFYPFVNEELDNWGRQTGKIKAFTYQEWLLGFVISLQFRQITTIEDAVAQNIGEGHMRNLTELAEIYKSYLLGLRSDTGEARSYIFFLQNLAFGEGYLPQTVHKDINLYLLRSIDGTPVVSRKYLGIYTKIGPILIITSVTPPESKGVAGVIHKRGELLTAQYQRNSLWNKFVFITRPNESLNLYKLSTKQEETIVNSFSKNLDRVSSTMHGKILFSGKIMENWLRGASNNAE